jgi:hypothetical protein
MNLCFETYDIQFNTFYIYADGFQNIFLASCKLLNKQVQSVCVLSQKSLPNSKTFYVTLQRSLGGLSRKKFRKQPVILKHFQKAAFDMSVLEIFSVS